MSKQKLYSILETLMNAESAKDDTAAKFLREALEKKGKDVVSGKSKECKADDEDESEEKEDESEEKEDESEEKEDKK